MTDLSHLNELTREINQLENELIIKSYLVEHFPNPIGIADKNGNFIYGNRKWFEFWGYSSIREVFGRSVNSFYNDEDKIQEIFEAFKTSDKWLGSIIGISKDGSEFNTNLMASIIRDDEGIVIGSTAMFLYEDDLRRMNGVNHG